MKKRIIQIIASFVLLVNLYGCYHAGYYNHPRHRHHYYAHRNHFGGWYQNYGYSR